MSLAVKDLIVFKVHAGSGLVHNLEDSASFFCKSEKMTHKIAIMEQKAAEDTKQNIITKVFWFLVFVRFIPVR